MNKKGNVLAIAIMFFLFAMISFVTGLQNPMGIIVKEQFDASNAMSQLGNLANFIAYAFMGLPAGFILKKYGYKVTSLAAVAVGFIGVGISWLSGVAESFGVYLTGAFVSGFSMCMLNTVVNPMLNTLGGGGKRGNQLIQFGGSLNSLSATIVPVFVGYLIGEVTAETAISDANPALFIAMGIFALAFIIIAFSQIPEPELEAARAAAAEGRQEEGTMASIKGALSHKNLVFGVIAIFLYVGIEVGIPNIANLYMTTQTEEGAVALVNEYQKQRSDPEYLAGLKALDELNASFAQSYEDDLAVTQAWTIDSGDAQVWVHRDEVTYLEGSIACVRSERYTFLGGAHGEESTSGAFYDLSSGNELRVDEALGISWDDLQAESVDAIKAYLASNPNLSGADDTSLEGMASDASRYFATDDGVVIAIMPYEVGPYSEGTQLVYVHAFEDQALVGTSAAS